MKSYTDSNLNEILKIHSQLKHNDKRATNKAVQELRKTDQEVKAAEKEIGLIDLDIPDAPNTADYSYAMGR